MTLEVQIFWPVLDGHCCGAVLARGCGGGSGIWPTQFLSVALLDRWVTTATDDGDDDDIPFDVDVSSWPRRMCAWLTVKRAGYRLLRLQTKVSEQADILLLGRLAAEKVLDRARVSRFSRRHPAYGAALFEILPEMDCHPHLIRLLLLLPCVPVIHICLGRSRTTVPTVEWTGPIDV